MIFLYSSLLILLAAIKWLMDRRVARLEKKYIKTARAADKLLREPLLKGGTSIRPDPCLTAKRQLQLGLVVEKRDRLEARYSGWQHTADRFGATLAALRAWKGKKLPYTLGALDVSFLLYMIDYLGAAEYANIGNLVRMVVAYLKG
jgi:hypothetical protein